MKIKIGVMIFMGLMLNATVSSANTIEETLSNYFEGYKNADVILIKKSFHEETRLLSIDNGAIDKTEMSQWLVSLAARFEQGDIREGSMTILSIDQTDFAAAAKVHMVFKKIEFVDYLSLLRINGEWKIVGKIYYAKGF